MHEEVAYEAIGMALNLLSIIKRKNKTAENPDSATWDMLSSLASLCGKQTKHHMYQQHL